MKTVSTKIVTLIAIFAMTLLPLPSFSQGLSEDVRLHTAFNGGEFATASPSVASMLRYGDCQLDLFHGRMGLRIPVYDYMDRDFTIPIALGYSTQGYQPGLDSGTSGLGWSLDCGGFISREVRGIPDDSIGQERIWKWYGDPGHNGSQIGAGTYAYDLSTELRNQHALNLEGYYALWSMDEEEFSEITTLDYYYNGALNQDYDFYWQNPSSGFAPHYGYETMSDIYHFCFLGISGDFVLQPCGDIIVYNCSIPSACIDVDWTWQTGEVHSHSVFRIRTGDGMSYEFGLQESSRSYDSVNGSISDENTNSTWLLTRITAPNGRQVLFNYSGNWDSTSYTPSICVDRMRTKGSGESQWHRCWQNADDDGQNVAYVSRHDHVTVNVSESYRLESVVVPDVMTAHFSYSNGHLCGISVRNADSLEVRRASMSYSPGETSPTFLKAVTISGQGKWSFSYVSEDSTYPRPDTFKTDNLGFYNGKDSYRSFQVPAYVSGTELESYATNILNYRTPSLQHAMMGALCEIEWPTGGHSTISYGLNKTLKNGFESDSYGIRPESIVSRDNDGNVIQKRDFYYVDNSQICSGELLMEPQIYYRYALNTTAMDIEREAVSTQSNVGLGPKAFQEYHTVLERISGEDPSDGVAEIVHGYSLSDYESLSDYSDYYQSSSSESAIGDGNWEYSYSNYWTPSERQMLGTNYYSGREILTSETDLGSDRKVLSSARTYMSIPLGSGSVQYPAMLCNRRCEFVVNPRHIYCQSRADSIWCSNGIARKWEECWLDEFCRPCGEISGCGDESRTVLTLYVAPGSLIPTQITVRNKDIESSREKVEYVKHGTEDSPWYLPSAHYRYDFNRSVWQLVNAVTSYDTHGNPTSLIDAKGNATELEWTADGLHLTRRVVHPSEGESLETRWEWSPMVGMTGREEPSGRTCGWTYDAEGRLIRTTLSGDTVSEAAYNICTESVNE